MRQQTEEEFIALLQQEHARAGSIVVFTPDEWPIGSLLEDFHFDSGVMDDTPAKWKVIEEVTSDDFMAQYRRCGGTEALGEQHRGIRFYRIRALD